jgi:hypothetical protein
MKKNEKRRKAQGEEINISNGALFLRIVELERAVAYLGREIDKLQEHSRDPVAHNIRIGGTS